jgi:hypothetical protein
MLVAAGTMVKSSCGRALMRCPGFTRGSIRDIGNVGIGVSEATATAGFWMMGALPLFCERIPSRFLTERREGAAAAGAGRKPRASAVPSASKNSSSASDPEHEAEEASDMGARRLKGHGGEPGELPLVLRKCLAGALVGRGFMMFRCYGETMQRGQARCIGGRARAAAEHW